MNHDWYTFTVTDEQIAYEKSQCYTAKPARLIAADAFPAMLAIAHAQGYDGKSAIYAANRATIDLTGYDLLTPALAAIAAKN